MKNSQPVATGTDVQTGSPVQGKSIAPISGGDSYEIKVAGHLDAHWAEWLGGLAITHDDEGYTQLSGDIPDQAALHGILVQIRDLGLPLISLKRMENTEVRKDYRENNT